MDAKKIGAVIARARQEAHLTQRQLGEMLCLSDKTISKWECGSGCPDLAMFVKVAEVLGINVKDLLVGDIPNNPVEVGNMKRIKFYVCPSCGNIITSTGVADVACCGKPLVALVAEKEPGFEHVPVIETVDGESYVHLPHDMSKAHFISFIAYATSDRLSLSKLYPEQGAETRFRISGRGTIFVYCNQHGLSAVRI